MSAFKHFQFPEKVFLSGADYFHLMLEINAKKFQVGNNVIRIALHFNDETAVLPLIENSKNSPLIYWMCNIRLVQGGLFQKPFWRFENRRNTIELTEHICENEQSIPSSILNRNISIHNSHLIEFDLIRYPSKKVALVLSWHHILMDGRGSGILLRHLNNPESIDQKRFLEFFPDREKSIPLLQQIKNMYEVKHFIEISSKAPISSIMTGNTIEDKNFYVKTLHFSIHETEQIDLNAKNNGARFGANLFLMACCAQAIHAINQKRNKAGTIWLPVPYDGRKRGSNGPVITNCISFLFYRLTIADLTDIKTTVQKISMQMAEQLKIEMPKKYNILLSSMRRVPLRLYHFLTTRSSKGVVSSFLYSSAGEGIWDMNTLMANPIEDVLIIPPLIYPPGLTFSFLRHNNALKMNIVYSRNIIKEDELHLLETNLKALILKTD